MFYFCAHDVLGRAAGYNMIVPSLILKMVAQLFAYDQRLDHSLGATQLDGGGEKLVGFLWATSSLSSPRLSRWSLGLAVVAHCRAHFCS